MSKQCSKFIFIILSIFVIKYGCLSNIDYRLINEFVVEVPGGYSEAISVAKQSRFIVTHKMMGFDNLYVFKYNRKGNNVSKFHQHRVRRSSKVINMEQQIARKRVKRSVLSNLTPIIFVDPLYKSQWYLMRSQNNPNQYDMNVIEAWNLGFTGKGIVVSILDDGIDYRHPDLKDNYDSKASYDINGGDSDPLPNYMIMDNRHGTRCAGEVSAKANNNKCGVGIAYNSKIGGVRMLDGEVTDRVEAEALGLNIQHIDIFSGSWGPDDNGQKVEGPSKYAKASIIKGITQGRGGLGNIYVWASGNGGNRGDSCSCDGYASSIYTLSVSSVSERNLKPWYLESCASTLISTYSSGAFDEQKIISTDLNGNCAMDHTGTSASAPLAAGIIALLLEANRNLTWRDVQYITVVTANTAPLSTADFITNGANRKVSNLYGFGLMDAGKMVRLGQVWQTLPPQHACKINSTFINKTLSGIFVERASIFVSQCQKNNAVNYVEHVVVYISINYQRRGDLQIYLISPSNTKSEILPFRKDDSHAGNSTFDKWPLISVQFWGELSSGKWVLEIRNVKNNEATMKGIFQSFSLEIYGTDKWPVRLNPPQKKDSDNWFQRFERFVVPYFNKNEFKPNKDIMNLANSSDSANFKCPSWSYNNTCNEFDSHSKTRICNKKCLSGTFINVVNTTCQSCHYSCDECTDDGKYNCSRCHVNDYFDEVNNTCKIAENGCSKGFYKDSKGCFKCSDNCSVCTSSSHCSDCVSGTVLTLNSLCKLECDLGSYVDHRGRCRVCHRDCLTCMNGNPNECTSCSSGSFLLPLYSRYNYGKCVQKCDPNYFTNYTTSVCYRCNENCKTCSGPSINQCTDCIPPLAMSKDGRTCIDPSSYNCKPDEFKSRNGICKSCPDYCKTCVKDRCTSCHSYRFLNNNSCTDKCPDDHFSIVKDNICLPCRTFCDPCVEKVKLSQCSQCLKLNNTCTNKCKNGQYWNRDLKKCSLCHSSCSECDGNSYDNCTQCSKLDTFLFFRQCIKSCPVKHYGYILKNISTCIACHPSCKDSFCDTKNGKCLECSQGYQLSSEGQCNRIITCPMLSFWNVNESSCHLCNPNCRSCIQSGICSSCHKNYCLHPKYSTCHPCCSPFCSTKDCFQCIAGREFCKFSDIEANSVNCSILQRRSLLIFFVFISATFFFIVIMTGFYKKSIIEILRNKCSIQFSPKYTIVRFNDEGCDDISSNDLSDLNSPLLSNQTMSYISLPTFSASNRNSTRNNTINTNDSDL